MLVVAVALLVLGALWVGTRAVSLASARAVSSHAGLPQVVVGHGDTLWTIADALPAQGDAEAVVRQIMRLNGLSSSLIRPGTRLYVPLR
ncbi:LysM peptidoglycan-binding domain-containing protein [Nonomuraea longicatena]|uniref:LysM domain-containing protein n=1 Tax=Nonomuraea longicatena TaxID=83682 RepID=A0ABN1NM90_9ACTN